MAFISTEEVRAIRNALKAEFPKYRFSVKKQHHSKVDVSVVKGPAFEKFTKWDRYENKEVEINLNEGYHTVNQHWIKESAGEKNASFFEKVVNIIKKAPGTVEGGEEWFDKSDSMTDYFHTAFYFSVEVGKDYQNSYVVTE